MCEKTEDELKREIEQIRNSKITSLMLGSRASGVGTIQVSSLTLSFNRLFL